MNKKNSIHANYGNILEHYGKSFGLLDEKCVKKLVGFERHVVHVGFAHDLDGDQSQDESGKWLSRFLELFHNWQCELQRIG